MPGHAQTASVSQRGGAASSGLAPQSAAQQANHEIAAVIVAVNKCATGHLPVHQPTPSTAGRILPSSRAPATTSCVRHDTGWF